MYSDTEMTAPKKNKVIIDPIKSSEKKSRHQQAKLQDFYKNFTEDYAPSLESTKSVSIKKSYHLFIDGKFVPASDKKSFATINPANEEVLSKIAYAGKQDVDAAVSSAQRALIGTWSKITPQERGRFLFRIARLIQERAKELAVLETLDSGKPIKESRDVDIPLAAAHFFYYAGWADKLEYIYPSKTTKPIGVCGQIIPWNFPLLMAAWKLAPALAAGNVCVLKPAETTPLTALKLCEIFTEAGLPPGVVNVITGDGITGAHLVNHPDINKIAFTGSTEVGKLISRSICKTNKKLTLELGGKSANIIFKDAALDQAIEGVINGIYFNQGQVCCAGSRLLIEEPIANIFIRKLKERMQQLRVGNPLDKNTDVGAINSLNQLDRIKSLVSIGKKEGGQYFQVDFKMPEKGYFHPPCFFEGQSSVNTIDQVEIFGPALSISTFNSPDEAITKANNTSYGLAAGIWSEKGSKVQHVASQLNAGVIWANSYNRFDPAVPFGGFNESGIGREGGIQGLHSYLEICH